MLLASDFDKSKYFRGTDLDREKKFRIKEVTSGVFTNEQGEKEEKLILWFTNDKRGFSLNKTNLRALRGAFGDKTAGWVNKVIALFPMMVDVRGKLASGLRVRILPPKPDAAVAASPAQPAGPAGNGAAAVAPPPTDPAAIDPELEPDPKLSFSDELNDEIPEKW
jgi:hypothetical protein